MTCGWTGRMARADLATGQCSIEELPLHLQHAWLGGRGLGVALLHEYAASNGFSAELPLIFAGGPLCGTSIPMSGRCVLTGRSPLTGSIFSCFSGGGFAWQLRKVGFDAVVVTGASEVPVQLAITPAGVSLLPADELWGLSTAAVFGRLAADQQSVAAIGQAGESGVLFASLETSDGESFARWGLGAVLGKRRLKAITICGGPDHGMAVACQSAFDRGLQDLQRLFLASPFLYGPFGIHEHGTTALMDLLDRRGMLPAENFRRNLSSAGINAFALRQQFRPTSHGCHDCPVACKRRDADGLSLPDFDALAALAGCCDRADLAGAVTAYRCCLELGLDPVSAAGSVAAWSEITGKTVSAERLVALLQLIASREGDGAVLAGGAQRMALKLGEPDVAMAVKGLELPPYDPRSACGLALAYAVAPHGGTDRDAWPLASEVLRKPVPTDPASFDGKARIISLAEAANAAMDSLVLCRFASCAVELEECAALLTAVTGRQYSPGDLLKIGEQIIMSERSFNQACGIDSAADRLPARFFNQPCGVLAPLDRCRFEEELARYQRIRAHGRP